MELIGTGAFTRVYLVMDRVSHRNFAMKVIGRDIFQFETITPLRRLLGQLPWTNIIEVPDFFLDDKNLYLIVEYAKGGSLENLLRIKSPLPIEQAISIASDVAKGLFCLHDYGVFCNLKPSNILFDGHGRAIIDVFSSQNDLGKFTIYPHISSEQSDPLLPASDIYSFGLILFEVLTGTQYKNLNPRTRPINLRQDVPFWLDRLVSRMLAHEPGARPTSLAVVREILHHRETPAMAVTSSNAFVYILFTVILISSFFLGFVVPFLSSAIKIQATNVPTNIAITTTNFAQTPIATAAVNTTPIPSSPALGRLEVTYPLVMKVEEGDLVSAEIIIDPSLDLSAPNSSGLISIETRSTNAKRRHYVAEVKLYPIMIAELQAQSFDLQSNSFDNKRVVSPGASIGWVWNITAKKPGEQTILVNIYGQTESNGENVIFLTKSASLNVQVRDKSLLEKLLDVFTQNIVAILGTGGPLGLYIVYLTYKSNQEKQKLGETIRELEERLKISPLPKEEGMVNWRDWESDDY